MNYFENLNSVAFGEAINLFFIHSTPEEAA